MENHKVIFLKVKIKSLAAEAKIIRDLEKKHRNDDDRSRLDPYQDNKSLFWGLRFHRIGIVRSEQFHTLLAYGYLRGRTFEQIAPNFKGRYDFDKVKQMVFKYGLDNNETRLKDWFRVKAR